jgi:signal transduction histidine kinase
MYWRIVRILMAILLLSTLLNAAFLGYTVKGTARRTQEATLGRFARYAARQIAFSLKAATSTAQVQRLLELAAQDFPQLQLAYQPVDGPAVGAGNPEPALLEVAAAGGGPGMVVMPPWPRRAGVAPVVVRGRRIGTIAVAVARSQVMGLVSTVGWTGLAAIPGLFVVSALVGLAALRWLRRRLEPISEVLDAIGRGELARRLPEQEPDEIGRLYGAFNGMVSQVESTVRRLEEVDLRRREFLVEVAHELKTPLTAVEGSLEILMLRAGQGDEHLARAYGESVRIRGLVADLLESARMEEPRYSLALAPVNVQKLLTKVLNRYSLLFERRALRVTTRFTGEPIFLELDERRIEQVFGNLLQNALDHTTGGGALDVAVRSAGGQVEVELRDDGQGMSAERLEQVREGAVRAHGHGVGLVVVGKLVELHGGQLRVDSSTGRGTTVTLTFPVSRASSPVVQ